MSTTTLPQSQNDLDHSFFDLGEKFPEVKKTGSSFITESYVGQEATSPKAQAEEKPAPAALEAEMASFLTESGNHVISAPPEADDVKIISDNIDDNLMEEFFSIKKSDIFNLASSQVVVLPSATIKEKLDSKLVSLSENIIPLMKSLGFWTTVAKAAFFVSASALFATQAPAIAFYLVASVTAAYAANRLLGEKGFTSFTPQAALGMAVTTAAIVSPFVFTPAIGIALGVALGTVCTSQTQSTVRAAGAFIGADLGMKLPAPLLLLLGIGGQQIGKIVEQAAIEDGKEQVPTPLLDRFKQRATGKALTLAGNALIDLFFGHFNTVGNQCIAACTKVAHVAEQGANKVADALNPSVAEGGFYMIPAEDLAALDAKLQAVGSKSKVERLQDQRVMDLDAMHALV